MPYLVPLMAARILFINYDFNVMTINLLSVQLQSCNLGTIGECGQSIKHGFKKLEANWQFGTNNEQNFKRYSQNTGKLVWHRQYDNLGGSLDILYNKGFFYNKDIMNCLSEFEK